MQVPKFNFFRATAAVPDLKIHPLLEKFMGNAKLKEAYVKGIEHYGHFEIPVITKNNEVLTHVSDLLAARQLNVSTMEVMICDLDESELPMFAILKHLTEMKNYPAIYDAIGYYTDYFKTDPEGINWSKRIKGDMDDKLAFIFGCSPSQVKRIRTIGNTRPAELGLIQQGEKSFREVLKEIKDDKGQNGEDAMPAPDPKSPDGGLNRTQTLSNYQYFTATIMYAGGDHVEVSVTEKAKKVVVNGKEVTNLKYKFHGDDDKGKNVEAYSHVFCPDKVNDASYQFILENPTKLFK